MVVDDVEDDLEAGAVQRFRVDTLYLGPDHPSSIATRVLAAEVTRTQFLAGVGHAIIHSKVIVIGDGLKDDDAWMAPMLAANQRELRFWGV